MKQFIFGLLEGEKEMKRNYHRYLNDKWFQTAPHPFKDRLTGLENEVKQRGETSWLYKAFSQCFARYSYKTAWETGNKLVQNCLESDVQRVAVTGAALHWKSVLNRSVQGTTVPTVFFSDWRDERKIMGIKFTSAAKFPKCWKTGWEFKMILTSGSRGLNWWKWETIWEAQFKMPCLDRCK